MHAAIGIGRREKQISRWHLVRMAVEAAETALKGSLTDDLLDVVADALVAMRMFQTAQHVEL